MNISFDKFNIVIADDDKDDHYLIQKAIWDLSPDHRITSVYNGSQLLDYLLRVGTYAKCSEPTPDCIFLDVNMPLLDGLGALQRIKTFNNLTKIPIYMMSTFHSEEIKQIALRSGATGFYAKNVCFGKLNGLIKEILSQIVSPPKENVSGLV